MRKTPAGLRKFLLLSCTVILLAAGLSGCENDPFPEEVEFAVVSDLHLYDRSLGMDGPAFDEYLSDDPKMLLYSRDIFDEVIESLRNQDPRPDFLLISGDLTKDGELLNHQLVVACLERLEAAGIEVFVIPGNHDINNPEAFSYSENGRETVASIGKEDFPELYADFGYAEAISRDPASLSYIAEPVPDCWLFALDSCRYEENIDVPAAGGRLRAETLEWVRAHLDEARRQNKTVIAMMHHGMVEHFIGQGEIFPDFVVEDWDTVGHFLAAGGMKVIFTGHFHAQDVTRKTWEDNSFIVDVETGSLATYPCYYRLVTLDRGGEALALRSSKVEHIASDEPLTGYADFSEYARDFFVVGMTGLARNELIEGFGMDDQTADELYPLITAATIAHFMGDEIPDIDTFIATLDMIESEDPLLSTLGRLLYTLWHDLAPADNELTVSLREE